MAALTGQCRTVEPETSSMACRLLTPIRGLLLAREARSSEPQTADRIGLVRQVGPPVFFGAFRLRTQITEQPSEVMERSSEQQMEEPLGLRSRAGQVTHSLRFHLPTRTLARLLVILDC